MIWNVGKYTRVRTAYKSVVRQSPSPRWSWPTNSRQDERDTDKSCINTLVPLFNPCYRLCPSRPCINTIVPLNKNERIILFMHSGAASQPTRIGLRKSKCFPNAGQSCRYSVWMNKWNILLYFLETRDSRSRIGYRELRLLFHGFKKHKNQYKLNSWW